MGTEASALRTLLDPVTLALHMYPLSYPLKISVSLSSANHSRKLIEPERGFVGTSDL